MRTFFTISILCISLGAYAQIDKAAEAEGKKKARQTAIFMGDALARRDMRSFVEGTTYPKVMEKNGGLDKMVKDMEKQLDLLDKSGNTIVAAWPGQPSDIIDTAGEWQCTIPQHMKIKVNGGHITSETTLICLSPNKGNRWYFIDASDRSLSTWRKEYPNISSKLVIKTPSPPAFEPAK